MCTERNPCWSPDKKKIAFECDQYYWVDGEPKGRYDNNHTNIWVMNADGSDRMNLTRAYPTDEHEPEWSPDGKQIAFLRFVGASGQQLTIMNADGSGVRDLGRSNVPVRHFSWSNDGTMLILNTGGFLETVTPNTTPPVWTQMRDRTYHVDPDWNPTNDHIAYFGMPRKDIEALMQFGFPGGVDEEIESVWGLGGGHPSWAPDGCRIAFQSGGNHIIVVDTKHPDPTARLNLTAKYGGQNFEPDWAAGPTTRRYGPAPG